MHRRLPAFLCLLVLTTATLDVSATTVRRLANEDLAREAELIVVGRVAGSQARWVEGNLLTFATVTVAETLKGSAGETITVAVPGGIDSNRRFPVSVTYPGAPRLQALEEVVLFLVGDEDASAYAIAGFSQGKFSVVEDAEGVKLVSRDLTRVHVQEGKQVARGTRSLQRLSDFVEEIRGHVRRAE
jgi:hypothetical protein